MTKKKTITIIILGILVLTALLIVRLYFNTQTLEIDQPEIQITDVPVQEKDEIDYSGQYIGTTNLPQYWEPLMSGLSPGDYTENQITINVAEDGTVSGSLSLYRQGDMSDPKGSCFTAEHLDISGTLEGIITVESNWIDIDMMRIVETERIDCRKGSDQQAKSGTVSAEILIDGERIIGEVPEYFSFIAVKKIE